MCGLTEASDTVAAGTAFPEPADSDVCPTVTSVFRPSTSEGPCDATLASLQGASLAKSPGFTDSLGSAYYGQVDLDTGVLNGFGRLASPDTVVEGMWRQGKTHGFAKQVWLDGRSYEGEFRDGLFCGKGRMTWQHAGGISVYEGQYENDKKHGEGKFTWPSGRTYEGQWVCGKREGVGVETTSSGQSRGRWSDDMLVHLLPPSP